MQKRAAFFLFSLVLLSGCAPDNPEELQRLTQEDPAFRDMIASRDKIHTDERAMKADMLEKKTTADAQVDKIRGEYDAFAAAQNKKIGEARATIENHRLLLKKQVAAAEAELEKKSSDLDIQEKKLVTARKILKDSGGYDISSQEKRNWQERVLLVSEKIGPLKEAIEELKTQIRVKKRKIAYLR